MTDVLNCTPALIM